MRDSPKVIPLVPPDGCDRVLFADTSVPNYDHSTWFQRWVNKCAFPHGGYAAFNKSVRAIAIPKFTFYGNLLPPTLFSGNRAAKVSENFSTAFFRKGRKQPMRRPHTGGQVVCPGIAADASDRYLLEFFVYFSEGVRSNSKSSRECAPETWVRTRAVPCGTTG